MKLFRFKKWFFDVYASGDEYFLFFISVITVLGKRMVWFQAHGARKNELGDFSSILKYEQKVQAKKIRKNLVKAAQGAISFDGEKIRMNFTFPELAVDLDFSNAVNDQLNSFVVKGKAGGRLSWVPVQVRSDVNGQLKIGDQMYRIQSETGYVDLVKSVFLPFAVPISELFWGRLHDNGIDLSFTFLKTNKESVQPAKIYLILNGQKEEFDLVRLVIHELRQIDELKMDYPEKYSLTGENPNMSISIDIYNHRIAIVNDFIGDNRHYGKNAIRFLKFLTKNPRGAKSVAHADVKIMKLNEIDSYNNLHIIDEYVRFS